MTMRIRRRDGDRSSSSRPNIRNHPCEARNVTRMAAGLSRATLSPNLFLAIIVLCIYTGFFALEKSLSSVCCFAAVLSLADRFSSATRGLHGKHYACAYCFPSQLRRADGNVRKKRSVLRSCRLCEAYSVKDRRNHSGLQCRRSVRL